LADVLILDDDPHFSAKLAQATMALGHKVVTAERLQDVFREGYSNNFDVVFVDSELPEFEAPSLVSKLTVKAGLPQVIVFSDKPTADGAEQAIRAGAWDYIQRPKSPKILTLPLTRALEYRSKKSLESHCSADRQNIKFEGVKGETPQMMACLDSAIQAANSDASVLICGETGTGKEVFASAIHDHSSRARKNFVVVDCAALPSNLVESTLFGHKKGAFTGADRDQDGLVKQADGGTLFLDEVGELPIEIQKSFLRVLEERAYRPVGSTRELSSDFRLISATNRDLEEMAGRGDYRQDLLYRLKTFNIMLPPLRQRLADLEALAAFHLERICSHYGMLPKRCSDEFVEFLKTNEWPGNIRELANVLEVAALEAGDEPVLFPQDLPMGFRVRMARGRVASMKSDEGTTGLAATHGPLETLKTIKEVRDQAVAKVEKAYLKDILVKTKGNTTLAIDASGLSRSRFYALLKKHDISMPR
jgi:two-component system NtrC family response regulator